MTDIVRHYSAMSTVTVYKFSILRPQTYARRWDWSSGSPLELPGDPLPRRTDVVEQEGVSLDDARQLCAATHGIQIDDVSAVLDDSGAPVQRTYEASDRDTRSLRRRARDGEDW